MGMNNDKREKALYRRENRPLKSEKPKGLYKIARKERDGTVTLWTPGRFEKRGVATHYVTFPADSSNKPDYRFKKIAANGFLWALMWDKK